MEEKLKSICVVCRHFSDDYICENAGGKLYGIELSGPLALAEHDCTAFAEACFRLTPKAILMNALADAGITLDNDTLGVVWDDFSEGMERAGYVRNEQDICPGGSNP